MREHGEERDDGGNGHTPAEHPRIDVRGEFDIAGCIEAWSATGALERRRAIEGRIVEMLMDALLESAGAVLRRFGGVEGASSARDVVAQTVVELPTILQAYVDTAERASDDRFPNYLLAATRNIAFDMLGRQRRERESLHRLAERSSRLHRSPTTPSQREIRSEIRDLLDREFSRLTELDREILHRRAARVGFAQIGRELGLPRETVRDRFYACAERLQRAIERALGGDPLVD